MYAAVEGRHTASGGVHTKFVINSKKKKTIHSVRLTDMFNGTCVNRSGLGKGKGEGEERQAFVGDKSDQHWRHLLPPGKEGVSGIVAVWCYTLLVVHQQ